MLLWSDLCNSAPSGLIQHVPILFAAEEALSMSTTVYHTKINEAVTKQAVTEDVVTQYRSDWGRRISILAVLGH